MLCLTARRIAPYDFEMLEPACRHIERIWLVSIVGRIDANAESTDRIAPKALGSERLLVEIVA